MSVPQLNSKYQGLGNDSRYFVVTGGRSSGKSFAVGSFLAINTYNGTSTRYCSPGIQ